MTKKKHRTHILKMRQTCVMNQTTPRSNRDWTDEDRNGDNQNPKPERLPRIKHSVDGNYKLAVKSRMRAEDIKGARSEETINSQDLDSRIIENTEPEIRTTTTRLRTRINLQGEAYSEQRDEQCVIYWSCHSNLLTTLDPRYLNTQRTTV